MTLSVRKGIYRHYKGKRYRVLGTARHSESPEKMVVYQALYSSKKFGNRALWVRSQKMFLETVLVEGKKVPRFQFVRK